MEIIPENDIPTENVYELQALYHTHIGQPAMAREYLDSMRVARNHRKEKQNPLILLYAEHAQHENTKAESSRKEEIYRRNIQYLLFISGLIMILLVLSIFLYKRQQKAYRSLAYQSKQWAEETTLEIVATTEEFEIVRRAHELMNGGLFRDCDLSLNSLAEKLAVNRNVLSRAINRVTGKRFNLFVNEYRIKEAIKRIEYTPHNSKNLYIDEMYQELGFNSSVTFFRIFKQITGLSPGAFFNQIDKQDKS